MPRETRAPEAERAQRLMIVQDLIVRGWRGSDVWSYVQQETDWNISRRQAYNYYQDAFDALADESEVNRAAYFSLVLQRNEYLYQKAMSKDKPDLNLARLLVADLIKLLKLDEPSADFDWKAEAAKKGYDPTQILERLKRLTADDNGELIEAPEKDTAHDNG